MLLQLLKPRANSNQTRQAEPAKSAVQRLRLMIVLIFIFSSLSLAGVSVWSARQEATHNATLRLDAALNYLTSWLEDQNTSNKIAAEGLATQRNVVAALLQHERGKPELERILAAGLLRKLDVSFIAFVDTNHQVLASDPANLPMEWLPKTTIEAALGGQPLPPGAEQGQGKLLLTASASVVSENQPVGAIVLGDLLDESSTTAADLKRVTGLEVIVVSNGKLQATTLPFLTTKDPARIMPLPDLSEIETVLKSKDRFTGDISLNGQTYKVGYSALLSKRFLVGEILLLLPQAELEQSWWGQISPSLVSLPFIWLVGGLLIFYLFNRYLIYPETLLPPRGKAGAAILTEKDATGLVVGKTEASFSPSPLSNRLGQQIRVPLPARSESSLNLIPSATELDTADECYISHQTAISLTEAEQLKKASTNPGVLLVVSEKHSQEIGVGAGKEEEGWEYFGKLGLNRAAYEVKLDGQLLNMTRTEIELLGVLASRPNKVISRNELINFIWGGEYLGEPGTVDAHISNLRRKVENDPAKPTLIVTVRGVGYKFQPPA